MAFEWLSRVTDTTTLDDGSYPTLKSWAISKLRYDS